MSHSKHFLSDYHYYIKKIAVTLGCPIQLNGVNGTVRRVNKIYFKFKNCRETSSNP